MILVCLHVTLLLIPIQQDFQMLLQGLSRADLKVPHTSKVKKKKTNNKKTNLSQWKLLLKEWNNSNAPTVEEETLPCDCWLCQPPLNWAYAEDTNPSPGLWGEWNTLE